MRGPATIAIAASLLFASATNANEPAPNEALAFGELQRRIIEVSDQVKPTVVHIDAIVKINDRRKRVEGSGVVLSSDGRIITNQHVVDKAQKVEVTVPGRKQKYPAEVVGADKQTDIALLKIKPDVPLVAAEYGSVDDLRVGQWVLAVGNPYGLDGTVSFGIVSAKGRNLEVDELINDFIQTDAMIDRGSSGGPLVDLSARVVGINSRGQGRGIGFTIPIDTALDVVKQIESGGVERGWIGVTLQPFNRDLASYFGIPDATGVLVNSVSGGSPAEYGGVKAGDIVTHFNGESVEAEKDEDLGSFQRAVAKVSPGETAKLKVIRDGKKRELKIKLGTQPKVVPEEVESEIGFHVQEITEITYRDQRLSTREGAYVKFVERGSPASEAGLRPGDVIQSIEKKSVRNLDTFRSAISAAESMDRFLIHARRGDETKYLLVKRGAKPATSEDENEDAGQAAHQPADSN